MTFNTRAGGGLVSPPVSKGANVKIKITSRCRVDGKDCKPGDIVETSKAVAQDRIGMGRAVKFGKDEPETSAEPAPKKHIEPEPEKYVHLPSEKRPWPSPEKKPESAPGKKPEAAQHAQKTAEDHFNLGDKDKKKKKEDPHDA